MPKKSKDSDSSQFAYKGGIGQTSTGLIIRVKEGESTAWGRFVSLYGPLIRAWLRKPGGRLNRQDRQDILQEVLRKVSQSIGDFDEKREGRSLRAWLRTITQNAITDHLEFIEKRKTVNLLASDTGHFKYAAQKPIEPFELKEEPETERIILLRQVMKSVKLEFSERDFEIVNLFINMDKTSKEVAEMIGDGLRPDTVRRIKNRVLARIRTEYANLGLADEIPSAGEL